MKQPRSPLKQTIDEQRVRMWYSWLRWCSGEPTAYALERRLLPEGFAHTVDGALSHRNRMLHYRDGKHVPRPNLVERAEILYPGGRALLEHPYWEILDPNQDVSACADAWLMRLAPDVQRIIFRPRRSAIEVRARRNTLTTAPLQPLEKLGTFDALAATALLMREALRADDARNARYCAMSFWRLLLVISSLHPFCNLLPAIAELADKALLHQVVYRDEQVSIGSIAILNYEAILNRYCPSESEDSASKLKFASWVNARLSLIRGEKHIDLLLAFHLPVVATPALQANPQRHAHFLHMQRARETAFNYCSSGLWQHQSFKDYKSGDAPPILSST
ncbi:hypothetical protein HDE76_004030 [Rhodanobacter sp. ANJX3]|uniref:hypothetical protein n=1 Tax=Rhodanobacter sp. ANJX3 TaxID=2723083 RepID=UPI0016099B91|nr:hypothetical protein [Rhodanobacter sp. ANJX3]MBB5360782.1 hypothetical protein [Rhodanobacter sp. ANJX3]